MAKAAGSISPSVFLSILPPDTPSPAPQSSVSSFVFWNAAENKRRIIDESRTRNWPAEVALISSLEVDMRIAFLWLVGNGRVVVIVVIVPHSSIPYYVGPTRLNL